MKRYSVLTYALLIFGVSVISCKKYIQIEPPKNSLIPVTVFKSNDLATSAVLGLYQQMSISGYASGSSRSLSLALGLSADEYIGYNVENLEIAQSGLQTDNPFVLSMWSAIYSRIYNANAILEGLEQSESISEAVSNQLKGEALFIRAFNYFYLANLFGAVPMYLHTDYRVNSKADQATINDVYKQIVTDLKAAETLLKDTYVTTERVRPNKATVNALLARTYLYLQDWENAEKQASRIIEKSSVYKLTALDQVFLSNSQETIWQLVPPAGSNTPAGALLILTTAPAGSQVALKPQFVSDVFEANDQRKTAWIRSILVGGTTYYYPFKYKVRAATVVTEYHTVFRLAEQFLIRAEARAQLNKLNDAIDDLDAIRFRANLPLIKTTNSGISTEDLLKAILKERQIELFSEWGHRWFDLKRTNNATAVLEPVKPKWKDDYVLFPIPKTETDRNLNIIQNKGYR